MTAKNKSTLKNLTPKQQNLVNEVVRNMAENGWKTKGQMLKDAGYSKSTQEKPARVFDSKRVADALEEVLEVDNHYLAKKQKAHLEARKFDVFDTPFFWAEYLQDPKKIREKVQDILDEDMPWARVMSLHLKKIGEFDFLRAKISVPDVVAQDKAIDKVYKIRGEYAPEKHEHAMWSLADLFTDE